MRRFVAALLLPFLLLALPSRVQAAPGSWSAGVATRVITPEGAMWLAGYAGRTKPAEGKEHDLFVKALALDDGTGKVVLLTSDLIGIPRSLAEEVRADVKARAGLTADRLMITCSHTHCGPVVRDNLADMYPMPEEEAKKIGPFTERLRKLMVEAVVEALGKMEPVDLAVGSGSATFAVNRRQVTPKGVINGTNPGGPVDHAVPVLRVTAKKGGKLKAVAFGYACHNTTLPYYRYCGDYAGFAQLELEKEHPGTVALFWAGCGADANPLPRGSVALATRYGKDLAAAVSETLKGKLAPVTGELRAAYAEIALPYATIPDRGQLAASVLSKNLAERKRAENLMRVLKDSGRIDDHYRHYPVQAWRLGGQVTWVALGGEVVVDYARRIKKETKGTGQVWVTGYANDVMAYIPSERVLEEGGYEADSSMVYYGLPSKWGKPVEGLIMKSVAALVKKVGDGK